MKREAWASLRDVADRLTYRRCELVGKPEAQPLHVEGARPTVVAIHGYCGVPREVAVVCEAAEDVGLGARAPLLAGHGTSARDLAPLRFADWTKSAEVCLAEAAQQGPVVLAGLSLGSLVALELTLRHPDQVAGLVLLGNALWLADPVPGLALRVVEWLNLPDFGFPKFGTDLGDPESRRDHTTYPTQPVRGAIDLQRAAMRLRAELPRITCPTLILHGARDRTCPVANAWRAAQRLGSDDVLVYVLPRSRHVLTRDVERDRVRELIAAFLRRYRNAEPPGERI